MSYHPTIGLEIHIELKTKSKMFCGCANDQNERHPNVNICPVCMGHPGTLPVINEEAIKKVIKTGLALNCQIPEYSKFDRKNYFYPDLPKGYQISQYDKPLCVGGYLEILGEEELTEIEKSKIKNQSFDKLRIDPERSRMGQKSNRQIKNQKFKKVRLRRVHLEEDTGRLIHPEGADFSLVDFNRAGIPLMELVTEPDINSAKEAREFAQELQLILKYLGVSDAEMEKGQMRVEANISIPKLGSSGKVELGTKVEIKNINSTASVVAAIEYEAQRQAQILDSGGKVIQETRGWNDIKGETVSQRQKEEAHDYRYFPEPDLQPLHFIEKKIEEIRAEIPELPQARRERLAREYSIDEKAIEIFVQNKDLGEYFEKAVSELGPGISKEELRNLIKLTVNYLTTDLLGLLKKASITDEDFLITPENFAEFITLIHQGKISGPAAKVVLKEMFATGADPSHIIEEKGLLQISDEKEIERIVKEVVSGNQAAVQDYKKGRENAFQFLVGQVMAQTKGKANPQAVNEILRRVLTKD